MSNEYQEMVEDIEEREGLLSDFQRDFISRMEQKVDNGESLTDWESSRLKAIHSNLTGKDLPA